MEVRKGYKQTEVGIIPEGWVRKQLSDISEFITKGATPTTYGFKWESSGILFLRSECVTNNGIDLSKSMFISELANKSLHRSEIRSNDLLITITGNVGRIVFLNNQFGKGNINQHIAKIRITDLDFDRSYVYHFLSQDIYRKYFESIVTGQAYPQISLKQVRDANIFFPPTKFEQTAIATALSDADALITSLEKLIEKKRAIKQGAMQKCLNPDFYDLCDDADLKPNQRNHTNQKNQSSDKWEVKKLGEIAEIIGGGTPSTYVTHYWNGTINWFTPTEIGMNKYTYESHRKLTKEGLSNCSARILPIGTILLTSRAGIGDLSILMSEGCTNQGFQSMILKVGYSNEYLYYLMQTLKNVLLQNASGSTFLEISPNKIKQIQVSVPDFVEQTRIATILSDMDAEITALEQKLSKYKLIKQGMMQELLTGKIRLNQDLQD